MFNQALNFRRAVMALALAACASLASAAGTLHVELNTGSYGSNGYIDIQLNSSPLGAVSTFANLSNFGNWGSSADAELSNVTGSLLTGFRIENVAGGYNDLFHAVDFSKGKVSFDVAFSGDADPSAQFGSTLSVSLFGSDKQTLLGNSSNVNGSLLSLNWTPSLTPGGQGSVASEVFGSGVVTTPVPEPTTWAMLAGGLALLGFARRRQQA
ncbi:PEP-CTERM protein-sorting domain-containing protein/MYXO-CTERM domain-containing protein [Duganella sacchari]|uniref:PEP-CTERM protein-sorting domain-containing protein/MYXO-CTERM domain-containing protein n=1 Tax=Duganella sacchari TaxID=551987 RepID=A0A1M7R0G1_9BURK|nr:MULTISPECIES: NF038129 family PEP-CTERM protein [Duganella]MYM32507.1 PEP-CTERM sorting domain-containing protein [Duganella sp. CY15W]SHN37992.1 PEP-CTERM protein-sorting domain-containing protein/MYXO-CTERM domain-containing protein [Duganella sacchari]